MATKYKCNQCGAEDSDRSASSPTVLSCWKCKSGRDSRSLNEQTENRQGMFQVNEQGQFPWEKA